MSDERVSLRMAFLVIVLLIAASWGIIRTGYDLFVGAVQLLNVVLP